MKVFPALGVTYRCRDFSIIIYTFSVKGFKRLGLDTLLFLIKQQQKRVLCRNSRKSKQYINKM